MVAAFVAPVKAIVFGTNWKISEQMTSGLLLLSGPARVRFCRP